MPDKSPSLTLRPIAGPTIDAVELGGSAAVSIGRAAECAVCLLDPGVSRRHATLQRKRGVWYLADDGSSGGTYVNGVKLPKNYPAMLSQGDLLRIGPWAFRVVLGASGTTTWSQTQVAHTVDDSNSETARIERAGTDIVSGSDRRLRVLSDCIAKLSAATDETSAARAVLEHALSGSGYARGAVLRRATPDGTSNATGVEVVVTHRSDPSDTREVTFSRTLLERAEAGDAVILTTSGSGQTHSHTIADMGIHSAICVPVMLAGAVVWFLYLDARGKESGVRADSAGFCEAAATAFGLAMSNIKRAELERRHGELHAELSAAREVQQTVMPPDSGRVNCIEYASRSIPGSFVAGDLFDVVDLRDGRTAVCLGDVAGHGAGSAMLMATAQAYLHALLTQTAAGDGPSRAVCTLNNYLCERTMAGRFISLWVGIFSSDRTLRYVDAGHGHWCVVGGQSVSCRIAAEGIPIGIDPAAEYADSEMKLDDEAHLIIYSDGIIEEKNAAGEEFGVARLHEAIHAGVGPGGDVRAIFNSLLAFRGATAMDDDATAASIRFVPA